MKRFSSLSRSTKPIRRTAVKKINPARKRKEFARCYHSKERVEFVKSLPCSVCGVVGYSENAHIKNGGTGRKADYAQIVPLCGPHPTAMNRAGITAGHHWVHDSGGYSRDEFEIVYDINLERVAARTEEQWQNQQRATA